MPSFLGSWNTTRYKLNDLANPEIIIINVTEDATSGVLDGSYPRPGLDARLFGPVDATGNVWIAEINEQGSSGDLGRVYFAISADGSMIHGAWLSSQHDSGPQPWFGTRV
jgi:hypothetical protein